MSSVRQCIEHKQAAADTGYLSQSAFEELHYSEAGPVGEVMGSAGDHQILDRHPPGLPERLRAGAQVTMVVVRPRDLKVLARKVKREAKSRAEGGRWVAVMEAGLMPAWLARSGVGRDGGMHWRLVRRFTQREGAWVDCRGDAFLGNRR